MRSTGSTLLQSSAVMLFLWYVLTAKGVFACLHLPTITVDEALDCKIASTITSLISLQRIQDLSQVLANILLCKESALQVYSHTTAAISKIALSWRQSHRPAMTGGIWAGSCQPRGRLNSPRHVLVFEQINRAVVCLDQNLACHLISKFDTYTPFAEKYTLCRLNEAYHIASSLALRCPGGPSSSRARKRRFKQGSVVADFWQ